MERAGKVQKQDAQAELPCPPLAISDEPDRQESGATISNDEPIEIEVRYASLK